MFGVYDTSNIFVQDGAACHKSRCAMQFLEETKVCLMEDWPPQSPDINVIKNLWAILKSQILKHHPKSLKDLWLVVKEEWEADDVIKNLYASIPRRIHAIMKFKGLHTKY